MKSEYQYHYPCPKCKKPEDITRCCLKEGQYIIVHCLKCGINRERFDEKKLVYRRVKFMRVKL
jgi:uncharacterized Zn finger protein